MTAVEAVYMVVIYSHVALVAVPAADVAVAVAFVDDDE